MEMLRRLHHTFPDIQESNLYAILRGLCREGCSEQYLGQTSGGPARKYYRLTPAGRDRLAALLAQWRALSAALAELGVK